MRKVKRLIVLMLVLSICCTTAVAVTAFGETSPTLEVIANNFDTGYFNPANFSTNLLEENILKNGRLEIRNVGSQKYFRTTKSDYKDVVLEFDLISDPFSVRNGLANPMSLSFGSPASPIWPGSNFFIINDYHADGSSIIERGADKRKFNRLNNITGEDDTNNPKSPMEIYNCTTRLKFIKLGTTIMLYGKRIENGVADGGYVEMGTFIGEATTGHVTFAFEVGNDYFNFDNISITKIPAEWNTLDLVNEKYKDFTQIDGEYIGVCAAPVATIAGKNVSWASVTNASSYDVTVKNSKNEVVKAENVTTTSYRLNLTIPDTYTISVIAKGTKGYKYSVASNAVSYIVLDAFPTQAVNFNSGYINPANFNFVSTDAQKVKVEDGVIKFISATQGSYLSTKHDKYKSFITEFDYVSTSGTGTSEMEIIFGGANTDTASGTANNTLKISEGASASTVTLTEGATSLEAATTTVYNFKDKTTKVKLVVIGQNVAVYAADMSAEAPSYTKIATFALTAAFEGSVNFISCGGGVTV